MTQSSCPDYRQQICVCVERGKLHLTKNGNFPAFQMVAQTSLVFAARLHFGIRAMTVVIKCGHTEGQEDDRDFPSLGLIVRTQSEEPSEVTFSHVM